MHNEEEADGNIFARLLTPPHNSAIVQLPGRAHPGLVIQGDSLSNLAERAAEVAERSVGTFVKEDAVALSSEVAALLHSYINVLTDQDLDVPFQYRPRRFDVAVSLRRLASNDPKERDHAADAITDIHKDLSELEVAQIAEALIEARLVETDATAQEAQLHALAEVDAGHQLDPVVMSRLAAIVRPTGDPSQDEYLADLLGGGPNDTTERDAPE